MKILRSNTPNKDKLMLLSINYHRPTKETNWNDSIDIIYKDLVTDEVLLQHVTSPEMELYFTKQEHRNYSNNLSFMPIDMVEKDVCKYKDVERFIAEREGGKYLQYYRHCMESKNRRGLKNLQKCPYVFGSDLDIENLYRIYWMQNYNNDIPKTVSKMYLDIEIDAYDIESGYGESGECPINAVTLIDEPTNTVHTFLLRNDRNPQIATFEDNIESFIESLHKDFDESYGEFEYKIYMYDSEIKLIKDVFNVINILKRNFLMVWNMPYDIPYFINRITNLGYDPKDFICHKDFPVKELYFKKDTINFKVDSKSDFFKVSSYTTYLDQMVLYASLRKGGSELPSYRLTDVAKAEIGDSKLDYGDEANMKTFAYINYEKFVRYNIKDVLLQVGIERNTQDIDNLYLRSYSNVTTYHKNFKQTVFLKNRAYLEYLLQNVIKGNNVNIDFNRKFGDKTDDDDDEKFEGALVADPLLNGKVGIIIFGKHSMFIFNLVIDMDFAAMYPNILIVFNIAPNCMIGKLLIDRSIEDIYNSNDANNEKYDAGKDFMDNVLTRNYANIGTKWFNMPRAEEIFSDFEKEFNIKDVNIINILQDEGIKNIHIELGI